MGSSVMLLRSEIKNNSKLLLTLSYRMFFNSRFIVISVFIWNFLALTCHAEDKVNRAKKDLEDLIAQASYGDKIETVRATQTENAANPVKKSESRSIDSNRRRIPMRNRNPLMKLPPGVLIRPGTSMGLKSISLQMIPIPGHQMPPELQQAYRLLTRNYWAN